MNDATIGNAGTLGGATPGEVQPHIGRRTPHLVLQPFAKPELLRPLAIFSFDVVLLLALTSLSLASDQLWVRLTLLPFNSLLIALLFVVGHDACHGSFTPHRWLNRLIGRLAFLPSLHSHSLWTYGHNHLHHRYTNLREKDYVFRPLSLAEYRALGPIRKWIHRFERSVWGHGFYYLRIWASKMVVPTRREHGEINAIRIADSLLVVLFAATVGSWLFVEYGLPGLLWGFVLPFLLWNQIMGFVIYLHHTDPSATWYTLEKGWDYTTAQLEETIHVRFPAPVNFIVHNILEHTAHHLKTSIPLYRLAAAQDALEKALPESVRAKRWTPRDYLESARICRLYDFEQQLWLDYDGSPSPAPSKPAIRTF